MKSVDTIPPQGRWLDARVTPQLLSGLMGCGVLDRRKEPLEAMKIRCWRQRRLSGRRQKAGGEEAASFSTGILGRLSFISPFSLLCFRAHALAFVCMHVPLRPSSRCCLHSACSSSQAKNGDNSKKDGLTPQQRKERYCGVLACLCYFRRYFRCKPGSA